jgi:peptidyl-prolyl cis-trans isomerase B (cyclophilin B)
MTARRGGGGASGRGGGRRPQPAVSGPIPSFDLYRVLNVRPDATHQEIVEAIAALDGRLRTAAARDRGGATARQKRLNVARHWLADPTRRRTYDLAVARGEAGTGVTPVAPLRGARLGAGVATRRRPAAASDSWFTRPLAWVGALAIVLVAAFLILRPGGGAAAGSPAASGSAEASGVALPSGSFSAEIPAGCPKSQPPAAAAGAQQLATVVTTKGTIEITLVDDLSPIAVGNFAALAACGYYDGVVFHRVVPGFVIQGGDGQYGRISTYASGKAGQGGPGYTIQDEPVTAQYSRATVAMARTAEPNSVGSQFFIVLADGARTSLAAANTYQIIGTVTKGMDVVDAIAAAADGENPTQPVVMTSVTVAAAPAGPSGSGSAPDSASPPAISPSAAPSS